MIFKDLFFNCLVAELHVHFSFYMYILCAILTGFCDVDRVGDKLPWWIRRTHPHRTQYTIYSTDPSSILYQEMLSHKATQTAGSTSSLRPVSSISDDSEFEMVGHEYYNGGSDITSSYYSDYGSSPFSPHSDPVSNQVPVSIEFHPATPTELAVITTTAGDTVPNETFLSLQANYDSQSEDPPSSPEQHQTLPTTPSPECITLPGKPNGFHTPDMFLGTIDAKNACVNSAVSTVTTSSSDASALGSSTTPVIITSQEQDMIELNDLSLSEFQTPRGGEGSREGNISPALSEPMSTTYFCTPEDYEPAMSTNINSPTVREGSFVSDPMFLGPPLDSGALQRTVAGRGRSVSSPEPSNIPRSNSWMNLTGGSIEMLQFTTADQSSLAVEGVDGIIDRIVRERSPVNSSSGVIRSVPWSAVSSLQ